MAKSTGTAPTATATATASTRPISAARGFTYATTTGCGKPVTVQHVVRRCYAVSIAGKVAGYITAASPTNAINRVAGNTLQTLKLHAVGKHPNAATAATLAQLAKH